MRFRLNYSTLFKPIRALSAAALLNRIGSLVTMNNNIERLAQIRAERLKRERDADPLGLAPAHLSSQLHLRVRRCASNPRRTPGSRADIKACSSLQLQACARLTTVPGSRLSSGRAAVGLAHACAQTSARGPPPTIVSPHPKPASQGYLRVRGPVPRARLNPLPSPPALTLRMQQPTCERTFTPRGSSA